MQGGGCRAYPRAAPDGPVLDAVHHLPSGVGCERERELQRERQREREREREKEREGGRDTAREGERDTERG